MRIEKDHSSIQWHLKGRKEFRIWFPDEWNPLEAGDNLSQGGLVTREISVGITRGQNGHYPYAIFLTGSKDVVESNSPPEMVIE